MEFAMNKNKLSALIAFSLAAVSLSATAQEVSTDWYFTAYGAALVNDTDRDVKENLDVLVGVGLGRYIAPKSSLDFTVDYVDRDVGRTAGDGWSSTALMASLRHYIGARSWQPYVLAGAGVSRRELDPASNSVIYVPAFQFGAGLQKRFGASTAIRTEIAYRFDFDDNAVAGENQFGDLLLTVGGVFGLHDAAAAPVTAVDAADAPVVTPPPPPPAVDMDDDNDGVLNADDKCPNTPAGEAVGPDGCPIAVIIDLRGVNFEFDKATLTTDSISILDQAVDVLTRYPTMKVEVAGHTDAVGTDAYNQGLSERRARVVYEYLGGHGIAADRLSGPNGYGESRPIDSNQTSEGRARNRRTELVKQK